MNSADDLPAQGLSVSAGKWAREPSPPWYGALVIICLGLMATILLTYTLADWGWQQSLGGVNYVVVVALIPAVSVLMRTWQADESI